MCVNICNIVSHFHLILCTCWLFFLAFLKFLPSFHSSTTSSSEGTSACSAFSIFLLNLYCSADFCIHTPFSQEIVLVIVIMIFPYILSQHVIYLLLVYLSYQSPPSLYDLEPSCRTVELDKIFRLTLTGCR